ncbi:hypothetical protein CF645_37710, partial [Burkholderia pseudomallei]|uniref:DUF3088 family protein n=1 Tax=Burkholderia pseudomallei TaxID=28450 RepID=UPI000CCF4F8E
MSRDLLLLLDPGFTDPRHPGDRFVCPASVPIQGLPASDPSTQPRLDISRPPFARPRAAAVSAVDADPPARHVPILGYAAP